MIIFLNGHKTLELCRQSLFCETVYVSLSLFSLCCDCFAFLYRCVCFMFYFNLFSSFFFFLLVNSCTQHAPKSRTDLNGVKNQTEASSARELRLLLVRCLLPAAAAGVDAVDRLFASMRKLFVVACRRCCCCCGFCRCEATFLPDFALPKRFQSTALSIALCYIYTQQQQPQCLSPYAFLIDCQAIHTVPLLLPLAAHTHTTVI